MQLFGCVTIMPPMALPDYRSIIETPAYDFLRSEPRLKDRLLFLCVSGSNAYGTNVEGSDLDVRGVALDPLEGLLGFESFEQFEDRETDTAIYSLSKFQKLAQQGNPNIVELFFLEKEHYLYVSPLGQRLLDAGPLFLTKKAMRCLKGFALAQWDRLESALLHSGESLPPELWRSHVRHSMQNAADAARDQIGFDATMEVLESDDERFPIRLKSEGIPLDNLYAVISEMNAVLRSYQKNIGKNKTQTDRHINKHMMHGIRLFLTAIEFLETGVYRTYRGQDKELLLSIRNGECRNNDGSLSDAFISMWDTYKTRFEDLLQKSGIPEQCDKKKIAGIVCDIMMKGLKQ